MTVSDILSCRGTFDFGRRYEIRWLVAGVDCGELNPNDSITRTRGVVYPARVCIPTVEDDPFDPASCKPNFRCPTPPRLSSQPTQQHDDDVSSISGHPTSSPTLPTAKSVLLSAAIGYYYYYLPRSCLSPHISHGRLSQISRVHSLSSRPPYC